MKPSIGDLVKVTWIDIQSDSSWEDGKWTLKPAVCTSYGIFYGYEDDNLRLFATYSGAEGKGERVIIPSGVVKKIQTIKRKVYEHKKEE